MIDEIIEFNKVKDIWSSFAITSKAKEQIKERSIILNESLLRREIKDTSDAKDMIEKLGNPPLQDVSEIIEILEIAEKGDCLTPYHLERVDSILIVLERLILKRKLVLFVKKSTTRESLEYRLQETKYGLIKSELSCMLKQRNYILKIMICL